MSLVASSKSSYLLLTMSYGAGPTTIKFTNNASAVGAFAARPGMKITGLHNSGGLDAKPITVDLESDDATLRSLADGTAWPPVTLTLDEVVTAYGPSGAATQTIHHAIGDYRLQRVYRNPERQAGLIRLEFAHYKSRIKVPLGIVASPQCAWTLGDKTCGVDLAALELTGTVASISGRLVTLTDPADAAIAGQDPGYYHRGVMSRDGLFLGIRGWDDAYAFQLVREPPAGWVGQTITVVPGCDKTPATCTARFANVGQFGGFGIAIPSYNPITEIP
jgi:hypothetical protein